MKKIIFFLITTVLAGCTQSFWVKNKRIECGMFDDSCIKDAKQKVSDEMAKKKKWEQARIKCGDYLDSFSGEWYSAGYSNRLYDKCEYKGWGDCWSWANRISQCVELKCKFEPVYYDQDSEYKYLSDAYITKKQFNSCN